LELVLNKLYQHRLTAFFELAFSRFTARKFTPTESILIQLTLLLGITKADVAGAERTYQLFTAALPSLAWFNALLLVYAANNRTKASFDMYQVMINEKKLVPNLATFHRLLMAITNAAPALPDYDINFIFKEMRFYSIQTTQIYTTYYILRYAFRSGNNRLFHDTTAQFLLQVEHFGPTSINTNESTSNISDEMIDEMEGITPQIGKSVSMDSSAILSGLHLIITHKLANSIAEVTTFLTTYKRWLDSSHYDRVMLHFSQDGPNFPIPLHTLNEFLTSLPGNFDAALMVRQLRLAHNKGQETVGDYYVRAMKVVEGGSVAEVTKVIQQGVARLGPNVQIQLSDLLLVALFAGMTRTSSIADILRDVRHQVISPLKALDFRIRIRTMARGISMLATASADSIERSWLLPVLRLLIAEDCVGYFVDWGYLLQLLCQHQVVEAAELVIGEMSSRYATPLPSNCYRQLLAAYKPNEVNFSECAKLPSTRTVLTNFFIFFFADQHLDVSKSFKSYLQLNRKVVQLCARTSCSLKLWVSKSALRAQVRSHPLFSWSLLCLHATQVTQSLVFILAGNA